ncbi:hypothetical protein [Blochmannia endosymbiont of Polyrhachis (Hedomyrma) turneri]|nr:hypothetical protein [Blochmannia endosymbiont of Polyrhachis (Hedomyrma) turneri]
MKRNLFSSTKLFMASAWTRFLLAVVILVMLWLAVFWSTILV